MKRIYLGSLAAFILAAVSIELVFGHSNQPQASKTGAPGEQSCTGCHSGTVNSGTGSVTITFNGGLNQYVQGQTYPITVTVTDPNFTRFGFQVTALSGGTGPTRGTFSLINTTNTSTQTGTVGGSPRSYVGHKTANSTNTWTFNWTAPTNISSPIVFYVAGNATNNNGSTSGDKVYTTNLTVTLAPPPPPVAAFSASSTNVCPSTAVTFTDNSTGTVSSRTWVFQGGNPGTSTAVSPSVTYATAGTYAVTLIVSNAGGADTTTISQYITVHPNPIISLSATPLTCFNSNDGQVSASVTNTSGNIFLWSNSATTQNISGLPAGLFTVSVTSNQGCGAIASQTVTAPTQMSITSSSSPSGCTVPTGSISLNVTNGTPGYTYLWSNGNTTNNPSTLAAGIYTVTVTDANGCQEVHVDSVGNLSGPSVTTTNTPSPCGLALGSATAQATGGASGYSYLWSTGDTTATISNLQIGSYGVTVTDQLGCTGTSFAVVASSNGPQVTLNTTPISCDGGSNGTATASVTSGTAPYTYTWSQGDTTDSIAGLSAGTYFVTVTDSLGCSGVGQVTVTAPAPISIAMTTTPDNGFNDGTATATPTGGVGNYTYLWNNGQTSQTAINLFPSTYAVTVTDGNGCTAVSQVTVGTTVGVDGSQAEEFLVSPNPFQQQVRIRGNGAADEVHLSIYDVGGKLHFEQKMQSAGGTEEWTLDLGSLSPGIYMLRIATGTGRLETHRIRKD